MKIYQSDEINLKGYNKDITNFVIDLIDKNIYQKN